MASIMIEAMIRLTKLRSHLREMLVLNVKVQNSKRKSSKQKTDLHLIEQSDEQKMLAETLHTWAQTSILPFALHR